MPGRRHARHVLRVVRILAFARVGARSRLALGAGLHAVPRDALGDQVGPHGVDPLPGAVEADSLAYLSLDSLHNAVHDQDGQFCYACYTGKYPTQWVDVEDILPAVAGA